jgi:hypothetical protein
MLSWYFQQDRFFALALFIFKVMVGAEACLYI